MSQPYHPAGGFIGPVSQRVGAPGWTPSFNTDQLAREQQDQLEREKYLVNESRRELQRFQTRRPNPPPAFQAKMPVGEIDEGKVAGLVAAIDQRGLLLNRSALIDRGKEKFEELLELNRQSRKQLPLHVEATSFAQLNGWCTNLFPSQVPKLDPGLQWRGEKLPEYARIRGLDDIWKSEPDPLVIAIYKHWKAFKSLVFGQSLLDLADGSNCVRSPFWASGLSNDNVITFDPRLELLVGWREFIVPPQGETFVVIELQDLLVNVVSWLADDSDLAQADYYSITQELTGLRSPQPQHVQKAQKLVEAFSLGLDSHLPKDKPAVEVWAYLNGAEGNLTRVRNQLETVAKRFSATGQWHREAIAASMVPQPTYYDGSTYSFNDAAYRTSIDAAIGGSILRARQLAAVAISEAVHAQESSQLAAAIGNQLILTSSAKGAVKQQLVTKLRDTVTQALATAFPGMAAPKVNVAREENL
jgi:hypothetical protein